MMCGETIPCHSSFEVVLPSVLLVCLGTPTPVWSLRGQNCLSAHPGDQAGLQD